MRKVKPDELSQLIIEGLGQYSKEINDEIKLQAEDCAKGLSEDIRESSQRFKGKGKYAKGWSSKKVYEDSSNVRWTVFNKTDYQLTHLLEYGHEKWIHGRDTGERVQAYPHIRPNAEKWMDRFEKRCKSVIANLSR